MIKVRNLIFTLIMIFILSACGATPTPLVIVVTATPLPPTQAPTAAPTSTLSPVAVAGPQSGDAMKWIDGSTLIYIGPGEFIMGNNAFDAPIHNVSLEGYWIQQTKVTNSMYAQCVAVGACTAPTQELGGPVFSNPEFTNHPVVGVTWDQAQSYCGWVQGRLPTEAEWEKAARGTNGNVYPWGNDQPACDLTNFGYCSGRTSEVDAFKNGASPYGLYDMDGNAFDWVADWYNQTYYKDGPSVNPPGPDSGDFRVVRGSSFETEPGQAESALRHPLAPSLHRRDTSFRCAVPKPQAIAPYCQLAAFIPTGAITSGGCEVPDAKVAGQYCANGNGIATVDIPQGSVYDISSKLKCQEATVDGQRVLTCVGPKTLETTNPITVCNPTCSNSPTITGASPTCDPGYTLDSTAKSCNYTPILSQSGVAGCPAGYVMADRGGVQSCVIGVNANGQCPTGLYLDKLAGVCVPPNGNSQTPYGLDNPSLASQSYAGCATGFTYSDSFQCCQAVTGGTYPGCAPGSSFNADLGACSPAKIKLSGPGCVTVDVTTLKCSQPVDICSRLLTEVRCIHNAYACVWSEKDGQCKMKK
jgi:formylglycine-generating enzyme required for sulfatase activity